MSARVSEPPMATDRRIPSVVRRAPTSIASLGTLPVSLRADPPEQGAKDRPMPSTQVSPTKVTAMQLTSLSSDERATRVDVHSAPTERPHRVNNGEHSRRDDAERHLFGSQHNQPSRDTQADVGGPGDHGPRTPNSAGDPFAAAFAAPLARGG